MKGKRMLPVEINGQTYSLTKAVLRLPALDLIGWLSRQELYPKVFWKERDSHITRAAIGNLLSFSDVPKISSAEEIRFYGGIRFAQREYADETWQGFPSRRFWLPQVELSQEEGKTEAIFYSLSGHPFPHVDFIDAPLAHLECELLDQIETPDFLGWTKRVETILDEISAKRIKKLVLARKTSYFFSQLLSAWPLLKSLLTQARQTTLFAFELLPSLCFFGSTPEKLFQRKGMWLNTDAVASTRPRGRTTEEDRLLERELLSNAKEKREFAFVKEFLEFSLTPFSEQLKWEGEDRILKGSHVQHIHNRLSAKLKPGFSDTELIRTLHPTPALGGSPKESALAYLHAIEPFDRGWYGAPVGVVNQEGINLYAAIRSALLREHTLHVFAGTGIVEGSVAEKEWEELDQKVRPFTEQFTAVEAMLHGYR